MQVGLNNMCVRGRVFVRECVCEDEREVCIHREREEHV